MARPLSSRAELQSELRAILFWLSGMRRYGKHESGEQYLSRKERF